MDTGQVAQIMEITIPYLVQRATIVKPLQPKDSPLRAAIELDYMGSAEFEFGARSTSLKLLRDNKEKLSLLKLDFPDEDLLRVITPFSEDSKEWKIYRNFLLRMRKGEIHLKEASGFSVLDPAYSRRIDFWWDIKNHVMWSFHKPFMNRLKDYLSNSWKQKI